MITVKSVRVFQKNGKLYLDYYLTSGERVRTSTGMLDTKHNRLVVEKGKFSLAQEHYEKNRSADVQTLFKDIALEALQSSAEHREPDTQFDYENLLKSSLLPAFGNKKIGDILPKDIEVWKKKVIQTGISKSRFHKHWSTLSMIMKYLHRNRMITENPLTFVDRNSKAFKAQKDSSRKYYTDKEVFAILNGAQGWFRAFVHVLFLTGMRTSEGLALSWEDIDFEAKKITIRHSVKKGIIKGTKTGIVRQVDMSTTLYNELLIHYDKRISDTYLFPSSKTMKPYHGTNSVVRNNFKPLLKDLGIEYKTLYASRHSYASNLILKNAPLSYVQSALGHTKLSTTMVYVKNGLIDGDEMRPILDSMYSA